MLRFCIVRYAGKKNVTVVLTSHSYGAWEGWGTSLCWWAKIFGDRDDLADLFFRSPSPPLLFLCLCDFVT